MPFPPFLIAGILAGIGLIWSFSDEKPVKAEVKEPIKEPIKQNEPEHEPENPDAAATGQ